MNSLRKNFNEYIQIMDNHDMYNEKPWKSCCWGLF